jgi:hypothetical protein
MLISANAWKYLKTRKIELPYDPAISPLFMYPKERAHMCICPKEYAPGCDRATCTPMFIAALLTIAKL